jgi:hypothetical protein
LVAVTVVWRAKDHPGRACSKLPVFKLPSAQNWERGYGMTGDMGNR